MRYQGKIINISGHLGFVQMADELRFPFDVEDATLFKVNDIVEFDLSTFELANNVFYTKAIKLTVLSGASTDTAIKQMRLSKVAKELDVPLREIIRVLERFDVKIEASPNAKINNDQYNLLLREIEGLEETSDEIEFRKNIQKKYEKGTIIEVSVIAIIKPSQVITSFMEGLTGRISLLDIAWTLTESQEKFALLNIGDRIKCVVLDIDFENRQVKLGQKHLLDHPSDSVRWERMDRGDVVNVTIIESLPSYCLVKSDKSIYGLIEKNHCALKAGESVKVRVRNKLDDLDLILFVPATLEIEEDHKPVQITNDFSLVEPELRDFASFKRSILGIHASDTEIEFLKNSFNKNQNLFSKEFEAPFTLYISFESNSNAYETVFKQNAIPYFLNATEYSEENEGILLEKLSSDNYWVRFQNKRPSDDRKELVADFSIFNEDVNFYGDVYISKDNSCRYVIKNFSFGHTFIGSTEAKKRNSKFGSFLYRSPIKIVSPTGITPIDNSQKSILDLILEKEKAFEIVMNLKLSAGEILRTEGRTLALIDKFLEYKEDLLDSSLEKNFFVESFERTHTDSGTTAITFDRSIGEQLELEKESVVNIKVRSGQGSDEDLLWVGDGFLIYSGEKCKLTFNRPINMDALKKGFYIQERVSKRQLQVQREIIRDFLQKKIKIDHIESLLVQHDKIKPPIESQVPLINPDLIRTEKEQPDNNQIRAVRKAIGNQNVFLIQGPPGTGKTTVIAEIIEQLVRKGERILVTGQNHVAVDNVLGKMAKIQKLNLLRVGKEDKIDKELSHFHIDQQVEDYKETFSKFLANQLALINLFYDLRLTNANQEQIREKFNVQVNLFMSDYSSLQEILKHRHFILRDGLNDLSISELKETKISFQEWTESVNSEVDLLLKPLIYNSVDVVFGTCIGIKTDSIFRDSNIRFDTVIIDEAGKANIAETLVPIELGSKVILVGDQMQLPPYMDSSEIDPANPKSFPRSEYGYEFTQDEIVHALKTSFFEFLIKRIKSKTFPEENLEMLNYQHRMHPNIGKFVSESFYDGKVLMGSLTNQNRLNFPTPFNKEVVFFDTSNTPNPFEQTDGFSAKNDTEAEIIAESILPKLFEYGLKPDQIAIIAPYKSQVANISRFISKSAACYYKNLDVSTLDSFQGKEYDVILFSFTRSSDHSKSRLLGKRPTKVGFLDDAKRLNVAFSRAKKKLILIGNTASLVDPKSHFDVLFNYTNLFKNLVEHSKREEIGNLVNLTDVYDFRTPFELFAEKYKVGDKIIGKYRAPGIAKGTLFGYFFRVDRIDCLLPASFVPEDAKKKFAEMEPDEALNCMVAQIDRERQRISIRPCKDELWQKHSPKIKKGNQLQAKVIRKVEYGYFVSLHCGIEGLLHNKQIKGRRTLDIGEEIKVVVDEINLNKKQISFSKRN